MEKHLGNSVFSEKTFYQKFPYDLMIVTDVAYRCD